MRLKLSIALALVFALAGFAFAGDRKGKSNCANGSCAIPVSMEPQGTVTPRPLPGTPTEVPDHPPGLVAPKPVKHGKLWKMFHKEKPAVAPAPAAPTPVPAKPAAPAPKKS